MVLASLQERCPASNAQSRNATTTADEGRSRSTHFLTGYSAPSIIASAHAVCPSKPRDFAIAR
jgi:hypothetical protein